MIIAFETSRTRSIAIGLHNHEIRRKFHEKMDRRPGDKYCRHRANITSWDLPFSGADEIDAKTVRCCREQIGSLIDKWTSVAEPA